MASFSLLVIGLGLGGYLEFKFGWVTRVKTFVSNIIKGDTPSE